MSMLRPAAVLVASLVLLGSPGQARSAITDPERARRAVGYIASQQKANGSIPAFSPVGSTADAVLAMVAVGYGKENIRDALAYLGNEVSTGGVATVGLRAKVTMAAVAAGRNPRDFGGTNLVLTLRDTERPNGRYGAGTPVFEDALALLAIAGAGATPSKQASAWLVGAQCGDGGWQYDDPSGPDDDEHCRDRIDPGGDFFLSDTNTTALVLQALLVGSVPAKLAVSPFAFFASIRDGAFGGWGYSWGFETTDANSTALVIQTYAAAGRALPSGAMAALRALQYKHCGAFAFTWIDDGSGGTKRSGPDVGATIGAVLGVLREPLPLGRRTVTEPAPEAVACG